MSHIPPDHDTIVCHPDHADRLRSMVAGLARRLDVVPCHELDPGQVFTLKAPQMPKILPPVFDEPIPASDIQWAARRLPPPGYLMKVIVPPLGPVFVKESDKQENARAWVHLYVGYGWRKARSSLQVLLDPNYRHPKRKRP